MTEGVPPPKTESVGYSKKFCNKCAQYGHSMYMCLAFKTRPCKFFYSGRCHKLSSQCMYAHGDAELRPSSLSWCTRITYVNGTRTVEGCCNPGHTIDACHQLTRGEWVPGVLVSVSGTESQTTATESTE
jgi:hypothetical protein